MVPFSAICVFCEDIREEKSGQDSIIGTLPDNLIAQGSPPQSVPNARVFLPRMGIYLRIHLDAAQETPKKISAKVISTDGETIVQTGWDSAIVDKTFADSKENHMPVVGLIFKAVIHPFPITLEGGKIIAVAVVDGVESIAGALNVVVPTA